MSTPSKIVFRFWWTKGVTLSTLPLPELAPGETTVVVNQFSTNANGVTTLSGKLAGARLA